MMVLPPSAKLAINAAVPVMSSSAMPSCSEKLAPVISGSVYVTLSGACRDHGLATEGEANPPGSVAIVGFTGEEKPTSNREGLPWPHLQRKPVGRNANEQAPCPPDEIRPEWKAASPANLSRRQRDITAAILQHEVCRQFVAFSPYLALVLSVGELRLFRTTAGRREAQLVLLAVGPGIQLCRAAPAPRPIRCRAGPSRPAGKRNMRSAANRS